jgi:hypothetical protein
MLARLRALFAPKPLLVVVNDTPHMLPRGERIDAVALDGSSLHVLRRTDGSFVIEAFEAPIRSGKRNKR